jgi:NAD-dependent deacetylase sirtuin 1
LHLKKAQNILIVTGAGISVSAGIPDFRSKTTGIFSQISQKYPELKNNPQNLTNIEFFQKDPRHFFNFAKHLWPGKYKPTKTHHFLKKLETSNKLLRLYTQNIDCLENQVGIDSTKLVHCHGNFEKATCRKCNKKFSYKDIEKEIFKGEIPYCDICPKNLRFDPKLKANETLPIIKPDITFFGEDLPKIFSQKLTEDKNVADLVLVIGTSMKVAPVSNLPLSVNKKTVQILINREPLESENLDFDIEFFGNCDDVIDFLDNQIFENQGQINNFQETQNLLDLQNQPKNSAYFIDKRFLHEKIIFNSASSELIDDLLAEFSQECKIIVPKFVSKSKRIKSKSTALKVGFRDDNLVTTFEYEKE